MAGWGLMTGLGGGLQEVGSSMFKQGMADKLEKDREARAEKRRRLVPSTRKTVQDADGLWVERGFNDWGEPVGEDRRLNSSEITSIEAQIAKDKAEMAKAAVAPEIAQLDLEGKRLDLVVDREEADRDRQLFPLTLEGAALGNESKREAITTAQHTRRMNEREYAARVAGVGGYGGRSGGSTSTVPSSSAEAIELYLKNSAVAKEIARDYELGDVYTFAKAAYDTAISEGKNPLDTMNRALQIAVRTNQLRPRSNKQSRSSDSLESLADEE